MDEAEFHSLLSDLNASLERVVAAVERVPDSAWHEVIHTGDGAWTRHQLLCHMAANDLRQLVRIRIGAGIPLPSDPAEHQAELDTLTWNAARVAERRGYTVARLVEEMRANRASLVALLQSLTPARRSRPMPFRGVPTPLEQMVPTLLGHLDHHAEELLTGTGA